DAGADDNRLLAQLSSARPRGLLGVQDVPNTREPRVAADESGGDRPDGIYALCIPGIPLECHQFRRAPLGAVEGIGGIDLYEDAAAAVVVGAGEGHRRDVKDAAAGDRLRVDERGAEDFM